MHELLSLAISNQSEVIAETQMGKPIRKVVKEQIGDSESVTFAVFYTALLLQGWLGEGAITTTMITTIQTGMEMNRERFGGIRRSDEMHSLRNSVRSKLFNRFASQ